MRAVSVWISAGVLAVSLGLPSFLHAQDPEAPVPAAEPSTDETPPPDPPPAPGEEPPAAEEPPVEQVPEAEMSAAAPPAPVAPVAKGAASVSIVDYAFSPATVSIGVGDTVTWVNNGAEDHDAQGSGFATGTISPGSSGSATFSSPGTFSYVCSFHPDDMKGTVNVAAPDPSNPGDAPADDGTDPATGAPVGSEAAAAAAPGAAGSADALPASGEEEIPLAILGAGLLGCGAAAAALSRWRARESALLPPA